VSGHPLMHARSFDLMLKYLEDKGSNCRILSLKYSMAPGAQHPTPLYELQAAYDHLISDLSISPTQIILGGDSSGATMCLAFCFQIHETHPMPAGMFLVSPWVDSRQNEKFSNSPHLGSDVLTPDYLCFGISQYLQGQENTQLTSPIIGSPQGLPKMFISVGGRELMHDDIMGMKSIPPLSRRGSHHILSLIPDFARRCAEVNGKHSIEVDEDPTMIHNFTFLPGVVGQPAFRSMRKLCLFLQTIYHQ